MGSIKTAGQYVVVVALAHGLMSAAFVSAIMHISGGNGSDEMRGPAPHICRVCCPQRIGLKPQF